MSRSVRIVFRGLSPTDELAQSVRSWCHVLSSGTCWADVADWDVLIDQSYDPLRHTAPTVKAMLKVGDDEVQAVAYDADPYASLGTAFLSIFEALREASCCGFGGPPRLVLAPTNVGLTTEDQADFPNGRR